MVLHHTFTIIYAINRKSKIILAVTNSRFELYGVHWKSPLRISLPINIKTAKLTEEKA